MDDILITMFNAGDLTVPPLETVLKSFVRKVPMPNTPCEMNTFREIVDAGRITYKRSPMHRTDFEGQGLCLYLMRPSKR